MLRVDDTKTYQKMKINYEIFCEILAATFYFFSPLLAKLLTEKLSFTIIRSFKRQKLSSPIMSNLNMRKLHDS